MAVRQNATASGLATDAAGYLIPEVMAMASRSSRTALMWIVAVIVVGIVVALVLTGGSGGVPGY